MLSGFLNVIFNSEFFSIVIVLLILVLLTILSFLIKSQSREIKRLKEANALIIKQNTEKKVEVNAPLKEKEEDKILDITSLDNTTANLVLDLKNEEEVKPKEKINIINPIEAYEQNEEENAVISTKELEAIEKERDEVLGREANSKLIEEYENEQEKKAIISYNELLKNAKTLELDYIESPKEEANAPLIKQVEVKKQDFIGVVYTAEEEYLKILKDFKASLMLNG